jgi:murein DD-endopeptidase MepM/ murein hydrolase activator NlpD
MVGNAFFHPQVSALIKEFNKNNPKITFIMGVFLGIGTLGYAIGPYVSSFTVNHFGQNALLFLSMIGLLSAIFMYFFVPKKPQTQNKTNDIFFGHSITSPYGKRTQPTKGASTNHQGIDLSYRMNEPVKAFEGGMVVRVGKSQGLGNFVEIQDQNGIIHSYGHNNKITVNQGQYIKRGDEIALAGSTGISTGPHVHYSKKQNGKFIDPTQKGGAIQDGTVIKNAKTGQKMVMRNGQWQVM